MFYFNSDFYETDERLISSQDRGFLLGDGVFETLRVYAGSPVFLKKHVDRLLSAATYLEIPLKTNFEKFETIIKKLIERNGLDGQEASVRITLTRGESGRGLNFSADAKPSLLVSIFPFLIPENKLLKLYLSQVPRNERSPLARIKSLNYLESILARREAENLGFDEALFLNTAGHVSETAAANIFLVKEGILYTPRIEDGALPGVTREIILSLAQQKGLKTKLSSFGPDMLFSADEIFLSNSLNGVRPVGVVNQTEICRDPGPIYSCLSEAFSELIAQKKR